MFFKKGVPRNVAKFTGKVAGKVAGLRPATLLKKRLWHCCFPVNFVKFLRAPFLTEHLRWQLLEKVSRGSGFTHVDSAMLRYSETKIITITAK